MGIMGVHELKLGLSWASWACVTSCSGLRLHARVEQTSAKTIRVRKKRQKLHARSWKTPKSAHAY
jgi:hypothetical protein